MAASLEIGPSRLAHLVGWTPSDESVHYTHTDSSHDALGIKHLMTYFYHHQHFDETKTASF